MKKKKFLINKIKVSKITKSKYFIPNLYNAYNDIKLNTWFDLKQINNDINYTGSFKLVKQKTVKLMRAEQLPLNLNIHQQTLIKHWIEIARIVYNLTVFYYRKNKLTSFYDARKIIKPMFNSNLKHLINVYNVPTHVIDNAIADVYKSYKTSFALKKSGHIRNFKIRYKKYSKDKQTIVIEKEDFSTKKNGFYISYLGKIDTTYILIKSNILANTRLTYKKSVNSFILNIPKEITKFNNKPTNKLCSIDPGNKTFLTVYNPNGLCFKIFNRKITSKLTKLLKKRIQTRKILDELNFKDIIKRSPAVYKKMKKYYNRISNKIQVNVKELHYKSAHILCKQFDKIFLGKLSTQGITSKKNKMSAFEKHYSYMLSHDKFRTVLTEVAEKYSNKEIKIVCEGYTSKTCGYCGYIQKIENKDIYDCNQCKIRIDRDLNGARNILIKNN